jgi:hypothetical protein
MILRLYFCFMLLLGGGLLECCRRLWIKDKARRGIRP